MGIVWKPNEAFNTTLLHTIIKNAIERLEENIPATERDRWLVFITYSVIIYMLSPRGTEVFYLDRCGLLPFQDSGSERQLIIPLLG